MKGEGAIGRMNAGIGGLGEKVYDSYPPRKMLADISIVVAVMAVCILIGVLWGSRSVFGAPLWGFMFLVSMFVIPFGLAVPLVRLEERFKIYEGGVYMRTFKVEGDPASVIRSGKYLDWRHFLFEEAVSVTPFIYTHGSMLMTELGLRFSLPHAVHGRVAGEIFYGGWKIRKFPEVVDMLKTRMGPLWNATYRPDKPITLGITDEPYAVAVMELWRMKHPDGSPPPYDIQTEKDVARYVEKGMTTEDFRAISDSKHRVRKLAKELT